MFQSSAGCLLTKDRMIKNVTRLEHKVGDRVYHFLCDNDSSLGEIHDALAKFKSYVVEIINAAEKQKEQVPVEEPKTE